MSSPRVPEWDDIKECCLPQRDSRKLPLNTGLMRRQRRNALANFLVRKGANINDEETALFQIRHKPAGADQRSADIVYSSLSRFLMIA
jgi:hypothetical protein